MNSTPAPERRQVRQMGPAYLVLVVCLLPVLLISYRVWRSAKANQRARLELAAEENRTALGHQVDVYAEGLLGLEALFNARPIVTAEEWKAYIRTVELPRRYPGILSVGFLPRIPQDKLPSHVAWMRRQGFTNFSIRPTATRPDVYPITFRNLLEPPDQAVMGFDVASVPEHWQVMTSACDRVDFTASGKVRLLLRGPNTWTNGIAIYRPLYAPGPRPTTAMEGRARLAGFVYATVLPDELLKGIFGESGARRSPLDVEIYDDAKLTAEHFVGSADRQRHPDSYQPRFSKVIATTDLGRTWWLYFHSQPGLSLGWEGWLPGLTFLTGLVFALLAFAIARGQVKGRRQAEALSEQLADSQAQLQLAHDETERRADYLTALVDAQGRILEAAAEPEFYRAALAPLGQVADADRAYVFENRRGPDGTLLMAQTAEWCAPGVASIMTAERRRGLSYAEAAPTLLQVAEAGGVVNSRVADLPAWERRLLEPQGIKSILVLPIKVRGEFRGFIGFSNCRKDCVWHDSEADLLRVAAAAIATGVERFQALAALRDSEEHFRGIFELASEAFVLLEPREPNALHIVEVNEAACAMHGYTREELLGQPIALFYAPEDAGEVSDRIRRVLAGEVLFFETVHRQKDGTRFPVELSAKLVALGGKSYIQAVGRDVTEKKRLADELLKSSKLESVGLLAGGIAHDFNNALTVILGNLSLAKMFAEPGSDVLARLEEAEKGTVRARGLTSQLLTFAKGGAPVRKPTRLPQFVLETVTAAMHDAKGGPEFDLPEDLWPAEVDTGQLSHALHNLIANALQAMPQGGVVRVSARNCALKDNEVHLLSAGRYVRLSVQDHGSGIAAEHLGKVFDPYFTTKKRGGGLGLATVYSIIRKHGGQVTVDSVVGQGSTFHVYLGASEAAPPPPATTAEEPPKGAGRVLIMDDEEMIRTAVGMMLRRLGYEPAVAADGAEALRLHEAARREQRPFAAIIMDLTIPGGMGGQETIARLRQVDTEVKTIVSSGYANDPVMAEFARYGFNGVMTKPYQIHDLAQTMKALLS